MTLNYENPLISWAAVSAKCDELAEFRRPTGFGHTAIAIKKPGPTFEGRYLGPNFESSHQSIAFKTLFKMAPLEWGLTILADANFR